MANYILAQMGLVYCVNFNRSSYQISETHAEFWWGNLKFEGHLEHRAVDTAKIIFKFILKEIGWRGP